MNSKQSSEGGAKAPTSESESEIRRVYPRVRRGEARATRYMKRIVALCLSFCAAVIAATYVARWFGVDTTAVMTCACGLFGGELLMTCVLRLTEKRETGAKAPTKEEKGNG